MVIDSLDAHFPDAGSIERAALPPAMFFAWSAKLELLSADFVQAHQQAVTRLRFQDLSPVEFFTLTGSGTIETEQLSEAGRAFAEAYYPRYLDDFRATFDGELYEAEDNWAHYDRIARVLTAAFMAFNGVSKAQDTDRPRRWWQFWR